MRRSEIQSADDSCVVNSSVLRIACSLVVWFGAVACGCPVAAVQTDHGFGRTRQWSRIDNRQANWILARTTSFRCHSGSTHAGGHASCAFMMPVATPPNAIVFGSGYVEMGRMVKTGLILHLVGIVVVTGTFYFIACPLLGIDRVATPAWAQ